MEKRGFLTQTLATIGLVLVWLPVVAPVVLSLVRINTGFGFRFDYLLPAELFPIYLVGALFLVWAAWLAQRRSKLILWSLIAAVLCLAGGHGIGIITGLASGNAGPGGWQWTLVLASLVAYIVCILLTGVGGVQLLCSLLRVPTPSEM